MKTWTFLLAVSLSVAGVLPSSAQSGSEFKLLGGEVRENATAALSTFGIVAVPDPSASALSINQKGGNSESYGSFQIGGGFRLGPENPLYLEGYLGFQRYDPLFVATDGEVNLELSPRWTSVALTAGIGYDFRLTETLSFRPIFNLTAGHVVSDLALAGALGEEILDTDLEFLIDGGLTAGGYGGSLALVYKYYTDAAEYDAWARYTRLRIVPILGSRDVVAEADAATASLFARATYPIRNAELFGRPIRSLFEGGYSRYPGDQGRLLDIDWLARVGVGLEIDTTNTELISRARIVARYVRGNDYDGYVLGFGVRF